jgi:hypothetical protein
MYVVFRSESGWHVVLLDLTWTKLYACAFLCGGSIFVSRTHMHAADRQTLRHTCTDSTDYYIYSWLCCLARGVSNVAHKAFASL